MSLFYCMINHRTTDNMSLTNGIRVVTANKFRICDIAHVPCEVFLHNNNKYPFNIFTVNGFFRVFLTIRIKFEIIISGQSDCCRFGKFVENFLFN